jgi:hypothetical protein
MNDAIQVLAAAHAERLVPATQRPLPKRAQTKIDKHENKQCDCAELERVYTHENWHLLEGASCNCADIDWKEASEESCKSTVAKIKTEARNRMAPIYVPVLDEFATKLYADYANRHVEMTAEMKIRIETIEDIAISFLLHQPYCPEIVKPLCGTCRPATGWINDEDWVCAPTDQDPLIKPTKSAREAALISDIFGDPKFLINKPDSARGEIKSGGKTSKGHDEALSSFDRAIREGEKTRKAEDLTRAWVREHLAQNRAAGKSYQDVAADLDSLFGVKMPEENPKNST